jgi:S-DNA-T family DNA segregation ATPase FtsK/SpoIIIE
MEPRPLRREFAAICLTLVGLFIAGALIFQQVPPGGGCLSAEGAFGPAGTWTRCVLVTSVGVPGAVLVAMGAIVVALALFGRWHRIEASARRWGLLWLGSVLLVPVAIGLAMGGEPTMSSATGLWGSFVAHYLHKGFGTAGGWMALLLAFSTLTVVTLRWNPIRMLVGSGAPAAGRDAEATSLGRAGTAAALTLAETLEPEPEEMPVIDPVMARELLRDDPPGEPTPPVEESGRRGASSRRKASPPEPAPAAPAASEPAAGEPEAALIPALASDVTAFSDELPPTDLLTAPVIRNPEAGRRELDVAGEKLMATLRTFKVEGELVGRTTGPSVTQFEIEPAAGVKVRQIAALADDLAERQLAALGQAARDGGGELGGEIPHSGGEGLGVGVQLDGDDGRVHGNLGFKI